MIKYRIVKFGVNTFQVQICKAPKWEVIREFKFESSAYAYMDDLAFKAAHPSGQVLAERDI